MRTCKYCVNLSLARGYLVTTHNSKNKLNQTTHRKVVRSPRIVWCNEYVIICVGSSEMSQLIINKIGQITNNNLMASVVPFVLPKPKKKLEITKHTEKVSTTTAANFKFKFILRPLINRNISSDIITY